MQNFTRFLFIVVLSAVGLTSYAQTTILDQPMVTDASFNTFTSFNIAGPQSWYNTSYGAVCNGYVSGQSFENEDWLVSPVVNLLQTDNVKLTFNHTRGSAAVVDVGVADGWYKVFATADFTGDPTTTQWIELTGLNQTLPAAWQYVSSGELVIPDAAKSATSRIAFRYMSSAGQSATWEIKNVKVTGEPQATNPNAGIFKVTNWNIEWLGCTTFGPSDENLQISNAAAAMLAMNSDIYCIQEVTNTASNPTIAALVSLLGSDQWGGAIVPPGTDQCDQRQAIIYKKSRVQLVSSYQLSSGEAAEGNSYYYNWASGRFPAVYNVSLISGNASIPVSVVNIHAKAEDGDAMSYTRRLGASESLKTILDGPDYNSKNVILIGDFNDYLLGTTSQACSCSVSPYQNFMDDLGSYTAITANLTDAHWGNPIIENILLSNELAANYVSDTTAQETAAAQNITNYYNTTSDHLPVSASFQFPILGNPEFGHADGNVLRIYPNPVKNELTFDRGNFSPGATALIYDLAGRQMNCQKINPNTIDVSALPSGIYILRAGGENARFVKE